MTEHTTTLGALAPIDFPKRVHAYVKDQAQLANEALGDGALPGRHRHVSSLETFADYLHGLDAADPRVWSLAQVAAAIGERNRFTPAEMQSRVLARVGGDGSPPPPESTLAELVGAAIADLIAATATEKSEAARTVQAAEAEARRLRDQLESLADLPDQLVEEQRRIDSLTLEHDLAVEQLTYLRQHLGINPDADLSKLALVPVDTSSLEDSDDAAANPDAEEAVA